MKRFGLILKKMREDRHLTQEYIAKSMGYKSKSAVGQIEILKNQITEESLVKYLHAMRVTLKDFLTYYQDEMVEIERGIKFPFIDMDKVNFDDLWHLKDKMYQIPIVEEYVRIPGLTDPKAFLFKIEEDEFADCGFEIGDYIVVSPNTRYKAGDSALVLIKPSQGQVIREVWPKDGNSIRLISKNDPRNNIDYPINKVKIYPIDSVIKKQRKKRSYRIK